jgi:DNA-directed RNA polymerase subunit RPC12/RpoP
MEALDGNAIAGQLFDVFGIDMTTTTGACLSCGATAQIAELRVSAQVPGTVVRCPRCGSVLIVLLTIHGTTRINLDGFQLLDPPRAGSPGVPDKG